MRGGASSIVTTRKQSNTNSSHSRGTAGAHRDSFLGGPGGSEKEIVRAWARMKDRYRKRQRGVWARTEMLKIEAIKER